MNYDNCPICNCELIESNFDYVKECRNGCYEQYAFYVVIFGQIFELEQEIKHKINYWKENDKYLIKLMGGGE